MHKALKLPSRLTSFITLLQEHCFYDKIKLLYKWSCRQGPSLSEADCEMVLQTRDPIIVSSKGMFQLISALFDPS